MSRGILRLFLGNKLSNRTDDVKFFNDAYLDRGYDVSKWSSKLSPVPSHLLKATSTARAFAAAGVIGKVNGRFDSQLRTECSNFRRSSYAAASPPWA